MNTHSNYILRMKTYLLNRVTMCDVLWPAKALIEPSESHDVDATTENSI